MTSEEHVDVKLLNGTLTADKLRITDSGEVVRFEGNVVMNLTWIIRIPADEPPRPRPSRLRQPAKTRSVSGKSANAK